MKFELGNLIYLSNVKYYEIKNLKEKNMRLMPSFCFKRKKNNKKTPQITDKNKLIDEIHIFTFQNENFF